MTTYMAQKRTLRNMRYSMSIVVFLASCVMGDATSGTDLYRINADNSHVRFSTRHNGMFRAKGEFREFSGLMIYHDNDPSKSEVGVTIKASSIYTGNEKIDELLRTQWFDAQEYPEITFASKHIEHQGNKYVAVADLTLHGVKKLIAVPFRLFGPIKTGGQGAGKHIAINAGFAIDRRDYGMTIDNLLDHAGLLVSHTVEIELDIQAVKAQEFDF